jgi:glycosyltransferase involved in cell wall biosynthesis
LRVLVLSTLYPDTARPNFGVFVRERVLQLATHAEVVVVAPVPWVPFNRWIRKLPARNMPRARREDGVLVHRPRFLSPPAIGKSLDPLLYFASLLPFLRALRRGFPFDVIDAEFGYPDGVAAARFGQVFRCPVFITMRGDEARRAKRTLDRLQLAAAYRRARVLAVSESLRQLAARFGLDPARVRLLRNGVDATRFRPSDRAAARDRLGLPAERPILLSVGWLSDNKGQHRVLEALPAILGDVPHLLYVAVGEADRDADRRRIERLVRQHRLEGHVALVGARPHAEVPTWLAAADLLCMATDREGCSNAVLEALACGVPVVTTRVGGNAELVRDGENGFLVPCWDAREFGVAVRRALAAAWDREAIARAARGRSWQAVGAELAAVMREARAEQAASATQRPEGRRSLT